MFQTFLIALQKILLLLYEKNLENNSFLSITKTKHGHRKNAKPTAIIVYPQTNLKRRSLIT